MEKTEKFAKLFDLGGNKQLLIYKKYDPDADETNIINITTIDEVCVEMKLSFMGEKQEEKSRKAFETIDLEGAQRIYEKFAAMMAVES